MCVCDGTGLTTVVLNLKQWGFMYEAYSESKYRFAVKKSSKVSYKILFSSDSTFFKPFFHIFAAIIEAQVFVYPSHRLRPPAMLATTDNIIE